MVPSSSHISQSCRVMLNLCTDAHHLPQPPIALIACFRVCALPVLQPFYALVILLEIVAAVQRNQAPSASWSAALTDYTGDLRPYSMFQVAASGEKHCRHGS